MNPVTINILGNSLAYYEKQGSGIPVLFIHGIGSNSHAFQYIWDHPNLQSLKLFALDLPGHGNSSWVDDQNDYSILNLSKVVAAFIEIMKLDNVVIVGHSLGGHIAIHALEFTKRISGFFFLGIAPVEHGSEIPQAYNLHPDILPLFKKQISEEQLIKVLPLEVYDRKYDQIILDSMKATDGRLREMTGMEIGTYFISPHFKSEIKLLTDLDVAFVLGEHEKLIHADYLNNLNLLKIWKGKTQFVKNAAHCPFIEAPDEVSELIRSFISEVNISDVENPVQQN